MSSTAASTMATQQRSPAHMSAATPEYAVPRRGNAGERLLDAATELFAAHGIRAVGIDRILGEAGVARASLYSYFGSKAGLVTAYLDRLDTQDRLRWEDAVRGIDDPRAKIFAFFDLATASAAVRHFRGCQYLNAATEFPGELGGMLTPVAEHRAWMLSRLTSLMNEAGYTRAELLSRRIQTIYDGALAGSKFEASRQPLRLGREMVSELLDSAVF